MRWQSFLVLWLYNVGSQSPPPPNFATRHKVTACFKHSLCHEIIRTIKRSPQKRKTFRRTETRYEMTFGLETRATLEARNVARNLIIQTVGETRRRQPGKSSSLQLVVGLCRGHHCGKRDRMPKSGQGFCRLAAPSIDVHCARVSRRTQPWRDE